MGKQKQRYDVDPSAIEKALALIEKEMTDGDNVIEAAVTIGRAHGWKIGLVLVPDDNVARCGTSVELNDFESSFAVMEV